MPPVPPSSKASSRSMPMHALMRGRNRIQRIQITKAPMNQSAAFFSSPNQRSYEIISCVNANTRMPITTYSVPCVFIRTGFRALRSAMYLSEQYVMHKPHSAMK